MQAKNLLFICSDQHSRDVMGAYGHPIVQTPHLDALAASGTRFDKAYTNCPICVPARASLATGKYVHHIGAWDNAFPYAGEPQSWGHVLQDQGYCVEAIGKLHFRSSQDNNGFSQEHESMYVVEGVGDVLGCIRDNPPFRDKRPGLLEAGGGDSSYLRYDARNTQKALEWLDEHAHDDKPWVLFLSYVCPHPPFIAPPEHLNKYPLDDLPMMPQWQQQDWPEHPALDYFRHFFSLDKPLEERQIRQVMAAYYALCSYLDEQIGRVLAGLTELGLEDSTRIIYTSDHGESLGARGLFGKFTLYDEAAAVPLILAGPDVPSGKMVGTPVSLVDCYPTVIEALAAEMPAEDLPGRSLWLIAQESSQDRTVLSEYHALGSQYASYMLRDGQYKYIHYVKQAAQLFDLDSDPDELDNLAEKASHQEVLKDFEQRLRTILDPDAIDALAKADQAHKVLEHGGREAVIARGTFVNSPTPDDEVRFVH
jgi:choline-sulfatase